MGGQVKHNLNLRMFTSVVEKIMLEGNGAGGAGMVVSWQLEMKKRLFEDYFIINEIRQWLEEITSWYGLENVKASYSHKMLYLPSLTTLVLQNSCLLKVAAIF